MRIPLSLANIGLKIAVLGLFVGMTLGCAEPKYVDDKTPNKGPVPADASDTADCSLRFKPSDLCLTWSWIDNPIGRAKGRLLFKVFRENLFDQTAVPVDLAGTVSLRLYMPSMHHPSRPTQTTRVDTGTFLVEDVMFLMAGDWELQFQELAEGRILNEVVVPLIR